MFERSIALKAGLALSMMLIASQAWAANCFKLTGVTVHSDGSRSCTYGVVSGVTPQGCAAGGNTWGEVSDLNCAESIHVPTDFTDIFQFDLALAAASLPRREPELKVVVTESEVRQIRRFHTVFGTRNNYGIREMRRQRTGTDQPTR